MIAERFHARRRDGTPPAGAKVVTRDGRGPRRDAGAEGRVGTDDGRAL